MTDETPPPENAPENATEPNELPPGVHILTIVVDENKARIFLAAEPANLIMALGMLEWGMEKYKDKLFGQANQAPKSAIAKPTLVLPPDIGRKH